MLKVSHLNGFYHKSPIIWTTVYSWVTSPSSPGWANYNLRTVVDKAQYSASGGKYIRVRFRGASGFMDNVFVGHQAASGDAYDYDTTPVRLTFEGLHGAASTNDTVMSDASSFILDPNKNLVIACHFDATAATIRVSTGTPGISNYYKSGANETGTVNVSSYTGAVGTIANLVQVGS